MSARLPAPKDGIVTSSRPMGWVANRWMATFDERGPGIQAQLSRGRALARGGRVRDLWFSPGIANAEVVTNREAYRVSVRVRVFEDDEWDRVVDRLLGRLIDIAAMLEGDLPESLVDDLGREGLPLLPGFDEIDGVCECSDFHMPCEHMAAVHNVVSGALDGDPFLLLTLRGLDRDQLQARLRRAWGDSRPLRQVGTPPSGDVPDADPSWTHSPTPLPTLTVRVDAPDGARPGVYALGPPPGRAELGSTLEPLYDAGAKSAIELAFGDVVDLGGVRAGSLWTGFKKGVRGKERVATPRPAAPRAVASPDDDTPLTEKLVDLLAELESAKSAQLAQRLGVPVMTVRNELVDLEKLGIVYRTGQTRGTKWWLG